MAASSTSIGPIALRPDEGQLDEGHADRGQLDEHRADRGGQLERPSG